VYAGLIAEPSRWGGEYVSGAAAMNEYDAGPMGRCRAARLATNSAAEIAELAVIYMARGVEAGRVGRRKKVSSSLWLATRSAGRRRCTLLGGAGLAADIHDLAPARSLAARVFVPFVGLSRSVPSSR
jgi:hypothetical protein